VFAYSSSKGCIRLGDMRNAALCDTHAKAYEETDVQVGRGAQALRPVLQLRLWEAAAGSWQHRAGGTAEGLQQQRTLPPPPVAEASRARRQGADICAPAWPRRAQGNKSFFSEIIASISDINFSKDGRYILSRDYMTLKLWDLNMETAPVATFNVHEHLRSRVSCQGWLAGWLAAQGGSWLAARPAPLQACSSDARARLRPLQLVSAGRAAPTLPHSPEPSPPPAPPPPSAPAAV
jgi:hypothetical protein